MRAAIEVTRNQYHIVVSITGPDADTAAVADMQAESAMIVGAVEKTLAGMRELDAIQGISVAFVHQHALLQRRKLPNEPRHCLC